MNKKSRTFNISKNYLNFLEHFNMKIKFTVKVLKLINVNKNCCFNFLNFIQNENII